MAEGSGTGKALIWAVALIVIVGIIMGALFYGGILNNKKSEKMDIDVDIKAPAIPSR
jgi:hypothetical protein